MDFEGWRNTPRAQGRTKSEVRGGEGLEAFLVLDFLWFLSLIQAKKGTVSALSLRGG
ncbi:hypothetical protein MYP_3282 [Sporocytophaga myxococcoides]|uniref:Uncharacterized protein n=1 Tax=Sporocytophaga myxococcoides TaxID=153721 RepID=A0A098LIQ0_9BACT|nr:hypothetical protein MYP_3282 [Sporocytophaga myxococcoides]